MIYLAVFATSTFFAYYANNAKSKKMFLVFSFVSILLPVALAAARDYSVGTDTMNYYTMPRFWAGAIDAESLSDYLRYYKRLGYNEYLFAFFCGVVAKVFGNYNVFLFLAHAVIVGSVYIGAFRMKHHANPALMLLVFYLMYFNASLNVMRQYMAMGVVFAALADLEQGKYVRYMIAVLVASLIHMTALLAFVPLLLFLVLFNEKLLRVTLVNRMKILCALVIVGALCFIPVAKFLIGAGVLPAKYGFYFQDEISPMSKTRLALRFLEVLMLCVCYRRLKEENQYLEFYYVNTALFLSMLQISNYIVYGQRIAAHFALGNVVSIAMISCSHKNKWIRRLLTVGTVALLAYYWYHTYVLGGANGTIPYVFRSC